jgi:prophage regulatory protein
MSYANTIRTALLRRKEVEARTGLPRSSIYALIAKKEFPAPVNLTARAVAWPSDAIDAWIAERIASAKKASA